VDLIPRSRRMSLGRFGTIGGDDNDFRAFRENSEEPLSEFPNLNVTHDKWIIQGTAKPPFRSQLQVDLKAGEVARIDFVVKPKPALTAAMRVKIIWRWRWT
jgi:hypothetical protein